MAFKSRSNTRGDSRDSGKRRASFRGEEGMRRAEEEMRRQKELAEMRKNQTHMPFRFRVSVGETKEGVILDDAPDFFRFEHNMKGPDGKWNVFTGCVRDFDNCPVCEELNRESYYAMYLSVLDFTEFETRSGDTVEFSRKLLVVKQAQQKKFMRFYEKEGTLRGAIFEFTRDGDKDSSIGNDIEFVDWMPEEELETYIRDWEDKDRKKHTEDCSVPFDYEELFPEPDADSLRALVGGSPAAGSRQEQRRELGEGRRGRASGRDSEREEKSEGGTRAGRSTGRTSRGEAETSRRGGSRGKSESADMEDWQDPDAQDGDPPWGEGEEQPARRGARSARRGTEDADKEEAPASRRRRAREEPEEPAARPTRRGRTEEPAEPPSPRRVIPRGRR